MPKPAYSYGSRSLIKAMASKLALYSNRGHDSDPGPGGKMQETSNPAEASELSFSWKPLNGKEPFRSAYVKSLRLYPNPDEYTRKPFAEGKYGIPRIYNSKTKTNTIQTNTKQTDLGSFLSTRLSATGNASPQQPERPEDIKAKTDKLRYTSGTESQQPVRPENTVAKTSSLRHISDTESQQPVRPDENSRRNQRRHIDNLKGGGLRGVRRRGNRLSSVLSKPEQVEKYQFGVPTDQITTSQSWDISSGSSQLWGQQTKEPGLGIPRPTGEVNPESRRNELKKPKPWGNLSKGPNSRDNQLERPSPGIVQSKTKSWSSGTSTSGYLRNALGKQRMRLGVNGQFKVTNTRHSSHTDGQQTMGSEDLETLYKTTTTKPLHEWLGRYGKQPVPPASHALSESGELRELQNTEGQQPIKPEDTASSKVTKMRHASGTEGQQPIRPDDADGPKTGKMRHASNTEGQQTIKREDSPQPKMSMMRHTSDTKRQQKSSSAFNYRAIFAQRRH